MAQQGRSSGGDLFDMAKDGTTVPADAAVPRHIKSVPRPGQAADASDPNQLGASNLADAADNAIDIPRVCSLYSCPSRSSVATSVSPHC